jgi:imidazolonepropionase-like amidohydrolase
MEAGTKLVTNQQDTPEQQLPTHLAMAVKGGRMTREEALRFTTKPSVVEPANQAERELPAHLQMAVDTGTMTKEAALRCLGSNA